MIRRRVCEKCGRAFTSIRIDARFHNDSCRSAARHETDAVSVRIRAVQNALSGLVEVAATEDEAWWTATLTELLDHVRTDSARIARAHDTDDDQGEHP